MCFVCKLPLVFSLYKHSTVRISCGDSLFCGSSTGGILRIVVILVIPDRLFAQLLPLCINLAAQLSGIHLCSFRYLFLLELLFVGTCFNMGPVNENYTGVYHTVVECFVENMFEDFLC